MAQYALDLTQSEAALIGEFTVNSSSGSATLSKVSDGSVDALLFAWTTKDNTQHAASWDTVGAAIADVQVLARMRAVDNGLSSRYGGLGARIGDIIGTITGYGAVAFSDSHALIELDGGDNYTVADSAAGDYSTYHWRRLECTGTTIRQKAWFGALEDEPGTWDFSVTDATYADGGAGLLIRGRSAQPVKLYVSELYVGTNGDVAAPTGPEDSTPAPWHHSMFAAVALAGSVLVGADTTVAASVNTQASTSAGLTTQITPSAAVSTEVNTSAGLTTQITPSATVSTEVNTSAGLTTQITPNAVVSTEANTVAGLTTQITSSATVSTEVNTVAGLTTQIAMAAERDVVASAYAQLAGVAPPQHMSPLALLNF